MKKSFHLEALSFIEYYNGDYLANAKEGISVFPEPQATCA